MIYFRRQITAVKDKKIPLSRLLLFLSQLLLPLLQQLHRLQWRCAIEINCADVVDYRMIDAEQR